jgi:hypothetical protein
MKMFLRQKVFPYFFRSYRVAVYNYRMNFSKTFISRCRQTDIRPPVLYDTGDKLVAGAVVTGDDFD